MKDQGPAEGGEFLAWLAARIDSSPAAARDPRTQALTVLNPTAQSQSGSAQAWPRLTGAGLDWELVDTEGAPVPHQWPGERGERPLLLCPRPSDLPALLPRLGRESLAGWGVRSAGMRTVQGALRLDFTLEQAPGLEAERLRGILQEAAALAARAGCARSLVTLHRLRPLPLACLVSGVPARGYRTLLLRPRAGAGAGAARPHPAPPAAPLFFAAELQAGVAACAQGFLPPSACLLEVEGCAAEILALGPGSDPGLPGWGGVARLVPHGAGRARLRWLLPVRAVCLEQGDGGPCRPLGAEQSSREALVDLQAEGALLRWQWA